MSEIINEVQAEPEVKAIDLPTEERAVVFEEALEAILFAAGHPISYATLARVFESTPQKMKEKVQAYCEIYNNSEIPRGVILLTYGESCQLCTKKYYLNEIRETLGIKREIVKLDQYNGLPWLWYEYWPEELIDGAPTASVPVMVLLHGNTNDPRTQAETSGFIQVAAKERFFVVEMEWQGSKDFGAMGYDGVEQVIGMLLEKYPQLDPSRVYAQGLSAGSITATALGIRKSYVFAAVGGNCGGIFSGARRGLFSSYDSLWADATQKRGAVEMAYCSILGTADMVVPFYTKENYKGNSFLNAWNTYQQMNGMDVVTDLDFNIDPLFGLELADRQTIVTNKGEGIKMETGYFYKGEKPLIKVVAVVDYGHWNFMPAAQVMWDYFKMFSRDHQTKKLIYHGE